MRSIVLNGLCDIENLRLSNPKQKNGDEWASVLQVKDSRACPAIVLKSVKIRKYGTDAENKVFTMLLCKLSTESATLLRALINEILSFISEKRNEWFPKPKRPKNFAVIQRCFSDPLDDKTPQLLVSSASRWSTSSVIEYCAGRHHDVHLVVSAVRFENTNIGLEFKIAAMRPAEVIAKTVVSKMRIPDDSDNDSFVADDLGTCVYALGPDSEDIAYMVQSYRDQVSDVRHKIQRFLEESIPSSTDAPGDMHEIREIEIFLNKGIPDFVTDLSSTNRR